MSQPTSQPMRQVIAQSWERAAGSGLLPHGDVKADIEDAAFDSTLVRAAGPVIDDLAHQLRDTDCALILADRTQRIVVSRFSAHRVGAALDDVAAVPGSAYSEQTSGTNAISTVFETGRGGFVLGAEHYLDKLHRFRCYGHPINHPITGVLEGVLDITGLRHESEGLMRALIVTAARAIEGRLLLASPTGQTRLLSAFQSRAARSHHAVLAFGRDITLTNDAAARLVDELTLQELRAACLTAGDGDRVIRVPARASAPAAVARIVPVEGSSGAFVVELTAETDGPVVPRGRAPQQPVLAATDPAVTSAGNLLLEGEPGSGRSTRAASQVPAHRLVRLDPATGLSSAMNLLARLDDGHAVLLADLDRFDTAVAEAVAGLVDGTAARLLATAEDADRVPGVLIRQFPSRVRIPPLRQRVDEIPRLAHEILASDQTAPSRAGRITTAAIDRMLRYPWPGNLTELKAVLAEAASSADTVIDVAHLPPRVARATGRRLTPLEEAEYRTIVLSLERHSGNKSHVAEELGIGRSTLYRRLRTFGLPT